MPTQDHMETVYLSMAKLNPYHNGVSRIIETSTIWQPKAFLTENGSFRNARPLIVFHAEMKGDIMYFHQAIRQPDAQDFVKAAMKEVEGNVKVNHLVIV